MLATLLIWKDGIVVRASKVFRGHQACSSLTPTQGSETTYCGNNGCSYPGTGTKCSGGTSTIKITTGDGLKLGLNTFTIGATRYMGSKDASAIASSDLSDYDGLTIDDKRNIIQTNNAIK